MKRAHRFLFLPSATGGGHIRASRAVAGELERQGAEIVIVDALKDYAPWPFSTVPDGYSRMLFWGGIVYGWVFKLLDHPRLLAPIHRLLWPWLRHSARRLLRENKADVIIVSHPLPVYAIARAAKEAGGPPVVGLTVDLVIGHALNVSPDVDCYLVATKSVCAQLRDRGVRTKIHETGLPVAREFEDISDTPRHTLRRELKLKQEIPVILLMTGGVGWGDIDDLLNEMLSSKTAMQIVVVAGGNESLRDHLLKIFGETEIRILGYVEDIHKWMRAADVLVTKAGPNTIAEALVLGIPQILTHAIPVQETPNINWILEAEAGIWAPAPSDCVDAITKILTDATLAESLRRNALRIARPDAAKNAANLLSQIAEAASPFVSENET